MFKTPFFKVFHIEKSNIIFFVFEFVKRILCSKYALGFAELRNYL